jgi:pyruvate dehydrogenase E2 component (dihydrolipoamide acetyltransferase)
LNRADEGGIIMAHEITLPKLGLTMNEGTIAKWHAKEGENIKKGQVIFEVSTDKITVEVESTSEGIIKKILMIEGDSGPVGSIVALVGRENEAVDIPSPPKDTALITKEEPTPISRKVEEKEIKTKYYISATPAAKALANRDGIDLSEVTPSKDGMIIEKDVINYTLNQVLKASPAAKALARNEKIDLSLVTPTGPSGRILERDVTEYLSQTTPKYKASPVARDMANELNISLDELKEQSQGRIMKSHVEQYVKDKDSVIDNNPNDKQVIPLKGVRKIIAQRMTESFMNPHVTINMEVDMTEGVAFRDKLKGAVKEKGGKLSYTAIIISACAMALKKFPSLNSHIIKDELINYNNINIGVAVDAGEALLVPVLLRAEKYKLGELCCALEDISQRARENKLNPSEIAGGTFTITNLGMYRVDSFTPIINPPEVAILGVNRIVDKPIVVNKTVEVRPTMNLSLSFDHRAIDGAQAAKFLAYLVELLENPYQIFI